MPSDKNVDPTLFAISIGALAGIMWSSILREHNLKFGYLDFLKIGVAVATPRS